MRNRRRARKRDHDAPRPLQANRPARAPQLRETPRAARSFVPLERLRGWRQAVDAKFNEEKGLGRGEPGLVAAQRKRLAGAPLAEDCLKVIIGSERFEAGLLGL
jgi:hypothetical protein